MTMGAAMGVGCTTLAPAFGSTFTSACSVVEVAATSGDIVL